METEKEATPSHYQQPQGYGSAVGARQQAYYSPSMQNQPKAVPSATVPGIPPGLEAFRGIGSLYVQEQVDFLEAVFEYEQNNRYMVLDAMGQRRFFAGENTACCDRYCCGNRRPFKLEIIDTFSRPILVVERQCSFCLWYCRPGIYGSNAKVLLKTTNDFIGRIEQNWSCTTPAFTIYDQDDAAALQITGPCCSGCCNCLLCCDAEFEVVDVLSNEKVGSIMKKFSVKEMVSDANNFGFNVNADMDVRLKAVLLAAVFLIDFTYFENTAGKRDRNAGAAPEILGGPKKPKPYPCQNFCQNCCGSCSGFCLTVILVFTLILIITIFVLLKSHGIIS